MPSLNVFLKDKIIFRSDAQLKFVVKDSNIVIGAGKRASGKTFALKTRLLNEFHKYERILWVSKIADLSNSMRKGFVNELPEVFPGAMIDNSKTNTLKIPQLNITIDFKSSYEINGSNMKGQYYDAIFADDVNELTRQNLDLHFPNADKRYIVLLRGI